MRTSSVLCTVLLMLFIFPESSTAIPISGTRTWGSFEGSITYVYNELSEDATLEVLLTNASPPANGGYITGFAFNRPSRDIQSVVFSDSVFELLGAPDFHNDVNAMPFGYFDVGAALGGNWQGGGDPKQGIGVGQTKLFAFRLAGKNLQMVDDLSFMNELSANGSDFFVVCFRGFENGESDKVPAGGPLPLILSSFSATRQGAYIEVSWTSQTEVNVLAYSLLRSQEEDGHFREIARLEAHGNSETPLDYRYVDRDVAVGRTYYYQLVDVDNKGNRASYGPVFATAGVAVPVTYSLMPNYPNPFNPSTAIGYAIPEAGHVRLTVYNVLGQEVRCLVDARHEIGTHTIMWDGKDSHGRSLKSGVYFYTLEAGDFIQTRKMTLMR